MELHGLIYTEKFNKEDSISNIFSDRSVARDNSYTINENFTKFKVKGCYVTLCTSGYLDIIDIKSYIVEYESFAKFSINTENQTLLYSFFQGKSLKKHIYIRAGEIVESFGEIKNEIESCKELLDSLLVEDFIIRIYDLNVENLKNNLPQTHFPTKKTNYFKWIVRAFYFLYIPRIISFLLVTPFALIVLFKLLFFSPYSCENGTTIFDWTIS